jgi:two-component system chemotaxis response regulator CheY
MRSTLNAILVLMRILVADDDRISRLLLSKILEKEPSYEVIEAANGSEAWALLERGLSPDLTILDIMMPVMDGLQLLQKMRADARFKDLSVLMCTVVSDPDMVERVKALGVEDYFIKPFSAQKVLAQVHKVFAQLPANESWEDPKTASQRLGIDRVSYRHLLSLLLEETRKGLDEVHGLLARGDRPAARWKINAIRDAGVNLGATGLVKAAEKLEARLPGDSPVNLDSEVQEFETEYRRLLAGAGRMSEPSLGGQDGGE